MNKQNHSQLKILGRKAPNGVEKSDLTAAMLLQAYHLKAKTK
jgi:hypothetical protein